MRQFKQGASYGIVFPGGTKEAPHRPHPQRDNPSQDDTPPNDYVGGGTTLLPAQNGVRSRCSVHCFVFYIVDRPETSCVALQELTIASAIGSGGLSEGIAGCLIRRGPRDNRHTSPMDLATDDFAPSFSHSGAGCTCHGGELADPNPSNCASLHASSRRMFGVFCEMIPCRSARERAFTVLGNRV